MSLRFFPQLARHSRVAPSLAAFSCRSGQDLASVTLACDMTGNSGNRPEGVRIAGAVSGTDYETFPFEMNACHNEARFYPGPASTVAWPLEWCLGPKDGCILFDYACQSS